MSSILCENYQVLEGPVCTLLLLQEKWHCCSSASAVSKEVGNVLLCCYKNQSEQTQNHSHSVHLLNCLLLYADRSGFYSCHMWALTHIFRYIKALPSWSPRHIQEWQWNSRWLCSISRASIMFAWQEPEPLSVNQPERLCMPWSREETEAA